MNSLDTSDIHLEWTLKVQSFVQNDVDFRAWETKRLILWKLHEDDVKLANSLEWRSAIDYVR